MGCPPEWGFVRLWALGHLGWSFDQSGTSCNQVGQLIRSDMLVIFGSKLKQILSHGQMGIGCDQTIRWVVTGWPDNLLCGQFSIKRLFLWYDCNKLSEWVILVYSLLLRLHLRLHQWVCDICGWLAWLPMIFAHGEATPALVALWLNSTRVM